MQTDAAKSQGITWKIQKMSSLANQEEFPGGVTEALPSLRFPEKSKRNKEVLS